MRLTTITRMAAISGLVLAASLAGCGKDGSSNSSGPSDIKSNVSRQIEVLKTGNDWLRMDAAQTLGNLASKDERIKPALEAALAAEKTPAVKQAIQAALKRAGGGR